MRLVTKRHVRQDYLADYYASLCQTPSKTHTVKQTTTKRHVHLFVCLSFCRLCLSGASILWENEARCFTEI